MGIMMKGSLSIIRACKYFVWNRVIRLTSHVSNICQDRVT